MEELAVFIQNEVAMVPLEGSVANKSVPLSRGDVLSLPSNPFLGRTESGSIVSYASSNYETEL